LSSAWISPVSVASARLRPPPGLRERGQRTGILELRPPAPYVARDACRPRHYRCPARAQLAGLGTQPRPALPLVQMRLENLEPAGERGDTTNRNRSAAINEAISSQDRSYRLRARPSAHGSVPAGRGRGGQRPGAPGAPGGFGFVSPHAALGGYIPARAARECRAWSAQPSDRLGVTPIVS
jgi:hypothetical protein